MLQLLIFGHNGSASVFFPKRYTLIIYYLLYHISAISVFFNLQQHNELISLASGGKNLYEIGLGSNYHLW